MLQSYGQGQCSLLGDSKYQRKFLVKFKSRIFVFSLNSSLNILGYEPKHRHLNMIILKINEIAQLKIKKFHER